jgi:alpha-beta hydrolase superfamily lysophospholipase
MSIHTLRIPGADGAPIPNTFYAQEHPGCAHLALLFPGLHYTNTHPALYYTGLALRAAGADVCAVDTHYASPEFQSLPDAEQMRRMAQDAEAVWRTAAAQRDYARITLVGKSLGTLALGHLLASQPALRGADFIWLTPLLRIDALYAQITAAPQRALFVIGDADPHYDPVRLAEAVRLTSGRALVLPGAHHGLEIEGDATASVRLMEQMVEAVEGFVQSRE